MLKMISRNVSNGNFLNYKTNKILIYLYICFRLSIRPFIRLGRVFPDCFSQLYILFFSGLAQKLVDVIFVMGASNPKAEETFDKEKEIANKMVDTPKDSFVKYGVVQFGQQSKTKLPLGDYTDEDDLKKRVRSLRWEEDGKSLDEGIKNAGEEFKKNGRPKAHRVLVVFMDGNDESDEEKLKKVSEPLKNTNVEIIVVAFRDVDKGKAKALIPKTKKPKKGKDPKELSEMVGEDAFDGKSDDNYDLR